MSCPRLQLRQWHHDRRLCSSHGHRTQGRRQEAVSFKYFDSSHDSSCRLSWDLELSELSPVKTHARNAVSIRGDIEPCLNRSTQPPLPAKVDVPEDNGARVSNAKASSLSNPLPLRSA